MAHGTVYDHIAANNFKTGVLVALFPISLLVLFYLIAWALFYMNAGPGEEVPFDLINAFILNITPYIVAVALGWMIISYFLGDKMMMAFAQAEPLPRDLPQNKQIYRLIENTALAAGLPMPKVYLIEDSSLNAFASGYSPQTASIALTRGIVNKLTPRELQAVIAHEMGHIGNRDIRLNLLIIVGVGIFGFVGEMLLRLTHSTRSEKNKDTAVFEILILAVALTFVIFNYVVAPILRLAVSRTREYAADATGALITRNPAALADALEKISQDPRVEVLDSAPSMASACIYSPLNAESLGSTHPPVEERIQRLRGMAGQIVPTVYPTPQNT